LSGFARRAPSREGLGTLPGFPSHRSHKDPEAERATDARSAAYGVRPPSGAYPGASPQKPSAAFPNVFFACPRTRDSP
jgi:hypothetical protein